MKIKDTGKWAISVDGESFLPEDYNSKEEAIRVCLGDFGEGYVGKVQDIEFDEEDILYDETSFHLRECLSDVIGSSAEDWEMSEEHDAELSQILAKTVIEYINTHDLQPRVQAIKGMEKIEGRKETKKINKKIEIDFDGESLFIAEEGSSGSTYEIENSKKLVESVLHYCLDCLDEECRYKVFVVER